MPAAQAAKRLHHAQPEVDAARCKEQGEGESQLKAGWGGFLAGKDPASSAEEFPALLGEGVFPGQFKKPSITLVDGERHGHPDDAFGFVELTEGAGEKLGAHSRTIRRTPGAWQQRQRLSPEGTLPWSPHSIPEVPSSRRSGSPQLHIVFYVIYLAATIYGWLIVVRALLSWFRLRRDHPLFQVRRLVEWLTEPYLRLFRRYIPMARVGGAGIDLSAMVGLIVLFVVVQVIVNL